jgi:hypothetical protein
MLAKDGLSASLVDPALAVLSARGAEVRFSSRLRVLGFENGRVTGLSFDQHALMLRPEDSVILAVPAAIAARIVPGLIVPDDYAPIVNAHFRYTLPRGAPLFAGLIGGTAEWVFSKREVVSVTVSAADRIVARPADEPRVWSAGGSDAGGANRQGAPCDISRNAGPGGASTRGRDSLVQPSPCR